MASASAESTLVPPGFTVERVLGEGGFGVVLRARRDSDGKAVAIKIARAGFAAGLTALRREAEALQRLDSTRVTRALASGDLPDGAAYLVLELVLAPTLAARLEEAPGPRALAEIEAIATGVARALGDVHAAGLVHRDCKPENFFVDHAGGVRVFDFGLVARTGELPPPGLQGEGTPEYMAPEQDAGTEPYAPAADVYAAGAVIYEMLTGAPPFWGDAADVREGHRSRRVPRVPTERGVPDEVEAVVLRCLAKDPARRPQDGHALADALAVAFTAARAAPVVVPEPAPAAPSIAPPAADAAAVRSEARPLAVVFARPRAGKAITPAEVKRLGAELANASPALGVALVWGHDAAENPVRKAYEAATRLIELGLAARACVALLPVTVQTRSNGVRRFVAAALSKPDSYPNDRDPEGVLVTTAALDVLPNVTAYPDVIAGRPQWLRARSQESRELTVVASGGVRMFGRDAELDTLRLHARRAAEGETPALATVTAASGFGKSELLAALVSALAREQPGTDLLAVRCQEALGGGESRALRELLSWALKLPAQAPEDAGRAAIEAAIGDAAPWAAVAFALGWLPADHPTLASLLAAPGALRAAVGRAAGEGLRRRARRGPVCVLLDDAHLADEMTLDALEYATLREGQARVFAAAFARPSFLGARDLFGSRAGLPLRIELGPLATEASMALARVLLAPVENLPTAALRKLADRTRGNPQLLVELVRGLKRDGVIVRSSRGESQLATELIDRLPDLPAVQWLATREIEALPPDLAAHARLAAVLGTELSEHEVEGVLALAEQERRDLETKLDGVVGLRRLVSAGVLVRHRTGRVSFRYEVLRDATYERVPADKRREIHDLAYRYLVARTDLADDERLPRLALHAARSERREEAVAAYLTLADRAGRTHAYLDAEALYVRAAELLQGSALSDPRLTIAIKGQALMRFRQGRYEAALGLFAEALARARTAGDRAGEVEIDLELATVYDFLADYGKSRVAADAAAAAAPEPRGALLETRLLYARARTAYRYGQIQSAVAGMLDAAARAENLGPEAYETLIEALEIAGVGCACAGELDKASAIFDRAFALCASHGDRLHEVSTYINRAFLWLPTSAFERLRADYERGLVISREYVFSFHEAVLAHNLAEVSYLLGDFSAAAQHAGRSLELGEKLAGFSRYTSALDRVLLARISLMTGDLGGARALLAAADGVVAESATSSEPVVFTPSDQVLRDMVELATAGASDEQWDALLARSLRESVQSEPVETHAVRGLMALRKRDVATAHAAFLTALDLAQRIPNCLEPRIKAWLAEAAPSVAA